MGCGSCGSDGGSCSSGCGKLDVHDWLGDMGRPMSGFDGVEVRFKGGRKEFFRNVHNLELYTGDIVVIESSPGHHVGEVTMQGEIVRLQLKKKKIKYDDDLNIIYRKATSKDIEKFEQARNRELPTLYRTREVIREYKLNMKLSDIEYQADNSKATFYYSAEERVDFRELIKTLATEFKIRVEMKQISLRQEASRLGGIGSCGRELCCSSWLTDFKNVSTSAARYQNLSLNPAKLSGQCGRLKCCLNYELETYIASAKAMPDIKKPLKTERGLATLQKTDILKKIMWFEYENDSNWVVISAERATEILKLNAEGKKVYSLELNEEAAYEELPMNNDLLALDKRLQGKNSIKSKKKPNRQAASSNQQKSKPTQQKNKPQAKSSKVAAKKPAAVAKNKPKTGEKSTVNKKTSPVVRKRQNVNKGTSTEAKTERKKAAPIKKENKKPDTRKPSAQKAPEKKPNLQKPTPSSKIRKRQNAVPKPDNTKK